MDIINASAKFDLFMPLYDWMNAVLFKHFESWKGKYQAKHWFEQPGSRFTIQNKKIEKNGENKIYVNITIAEILLYTGFVCLCVCMMECFTVSNFF